MLQIEGNSTIRLIHNKLHEKYLKIYEIYFGSAEGILYDQKARLEKQKVSIAKEEEAKGFLQDLRELSYRMLDKITHLENAVKDSQGFD